MYCDDARLLLAFHHPGGASDLAPDDAVSLESHLVTCVACGALARRFAAEEAAIKTAGRSVTVPAGLKDRLQAKAATAAANLRRVKWLSRSVAMAAAVTVGVMAYGGYLASRPPLDTYDAAARMEVLWTDPDRGVRDWLREKDVPEPVDFDFRLAVSHGYAELNGVLVPVIDLRSGTASARVYLVPPGRLNVRGAGPAQNSTATVQVFRNTPAAGWTLVVAYTGNSLQPFLRPPVQQ